MMSLRGRIVKVFVLAVALGLSAFVVWPRLSLTANEAAATTQRRRDGRPRRATSARGAEQRTMRDDARFLHRSATHKSLACNACHRVPTANWRAAGDYPDVADYPSHDACVRCHRQQFFKGARPAMCAVCHTRVSPRDEARFRFRHPARARQFEAEFPHDKHQDVIASSRPQRFSTDASSRVSFVPAVFVAAAHAQQEASKQYNNCAICHTTNEQVAEPPSGGWPDSFAPLAGTFKTLPTSHASCFNCHWKSQSPTRDDCAGCHKATTFPTIATARASTRSAAATLPAPAASPAAALRAATSRPRAAPRISNKFTHAREQHVAECTSCHIHITAASTLRGLRPDVPVSTCAPCHKTSTDPDIVTLEKEVDRRRKERSYTCAKCHTSDVGRRDVPDSHTSLFD